MHSANCAISLKLWFPGHQRNWRNRICLLSCRVSSNRSVWKGFVLAGLVVMEFRLHYWKPHVSCHLASLGKSRNSEYLILLPLWTHGLSKSFENWDLISNYLEQIHPPRPEGATEGGARDTSKICENTNVFSTHVEHLRIHVFKVATIPGFQLFWI